MAYGEFGTNIDVLGLEVVRQHLLVVRRHADVVHHTLESHRPRRSLARSLSRSLATLVQWPAPFYRSLCRIITKLPGLSFTYWGII